MSSESSLSHFSKPTELLAWLTLLVLPFQRLPELHLLGFSLLSTFVGLLFLLSFAVDSIRRPVALQLSWLEWSALSLVAWAGLTAPIATVPATALRAVFSLGFTVCFALALARVVKTNLHWRTVLWLFTISLSWLGLFGLWQFVAGSLHWPYTFLSPAYQQMATGFVRVQGLSNEPLYLNSLLIMLLPAPLVLWQQTKNNQRWWLIIIFVIGLITFLLGFARSGELGLLAGLVAVTIVWLLTNQKNRWQKIGWLWGSLISLLVVLGLSLAVLTVLPGKLHIERTDLLRHVLVQNRSRDIGSAVIGRLLIWQEATRLIRLHPIFGVGLANFGEASNLPLPAATKPFAIANNLYLELFVELGVVGLLLGLAFLGGLVVGLWQKVIKIKDHQKQAIGLWLLFSLIATLVQYNFFSTLFLLPIWVLFGLCLAYLKA